MHRSGSPHPGLTLPPPATLADRALAPCHTKGSRNQGQKIACAIAAALSDTLADCTRQPAHSRRRFSMVENRSNRPLASQPTPEPHPHREPAIFRMRDLIHAHHRRLHRCGSPCARSRARPAMSIACVVSDAHAGGPSVFSGDGDAERARIRLIGRSKPAWCNWRRDFRKQVFPLAHAHAPLFDLATRRGPKTFFRKPLRQLRRAGPHCLWRRRHAESKPFRRLRGGRGP